MVATKLSEVVSKGIEWAYSGSGSNDNSSNDTATPILSNNNHNQRAGAGAAASGSANSNSNNIHDSSSYSVSAVQQQVHEYADHAYSTVTDLFYSLYNTGSNAGETVLKSFPSFSSVSDHDVEEKAVIFSSPRKHLRRSSQDIPWMFMNPFNSVRGRHYNPSSLGAVRSLLINLDHQYSPPPSSPQIVNDRRRASAVESSSDVRHRNLQEVAQHKSEESLLVGEVAGETNDDEDDRHLNHHHHHHQKRPNQQQLYTNVADSFEFSLSDTKKQRRLVSKNYETASQLAEGSIRALRDLSLDEAVELHQALRFWSVRWENPMLSWLEAGPMVWFSSEGYNHQSVGQKVSRIQAVLARKCALIGELQQHLLRAGWQRGVAQWGVLGQGGQWAAIETVHEKAVTAASEVTESHYGESFSTDIDHNIICNNNNNNHNHNSNTKIPWKRSHSRIGESDAPDPRSVLPHSGYYANVFVRNKDGGEICMDDAALAEWSVDAMRLIRDQLHRTGNGQLLLPYEEHWIGEEGDDDPPQPLDDQAGQLIAPAIKHHQLPIWAHLSTIPDPTSTMESVSREEIVISDLRLMASEVSELLNVMEEIIERGRLRFHKLKPPTKIRQNWFVIAIGSPTILYLAYHIIKNGYGPTMIKLFFNKVTNFFTERVRDPVLAIIEEVWKGRERISDRKARLETISALKSMIRSWLDETYPDMSVSQRNSIAEAMDISLIEKKKAESMKTFYEINSVIRMSFIEMQFIKKEMMNALYGLDEMMSANDINMNLAAITPAVILLYWAQQSFKFLFYALLKLGKSKEETFGSFRHILTEVERLLVMRNNPPTYLSNENTTLLQSRAAALISADAINNDTNVLSADDLGMLMLHVHECRTILWNDRRRFTPNMIRSVSEDLAELAGERGAVSVPQQLQIIQRMNRTYPFLKVMPITSGFNFRNRN